MAEKKLEEMTDAEKVVYWEIQYKTCKKDLKELEIQFKDYKKDSEHAYMKAMLNDLAERAEGLLNALEEFPVSQLTCMGISSENVDILFKGILKTWVNGVKSYATRY